jgi:hypothetical protein
VAAAVAVIALAAGITALGSGSPRLFSWRPSAPSAPSFWTRSAASRGNEPHARPASVEAASARTEPAGGLRTSGTEGAPGRDETLTRSEAYLLMVASFKVEQNAARLARSLAEKNLPAFVVPDPATQWFAVAIGPYASAGEVNEVKTDVAKKFNLAETHVRVERP